MDFLKRFFDGDGDEILFFVLVFLLIFNGSTFNRDKDERTDDRSDSGSILFFIVLFLLLFINTDNA